MGDKPLVDSSPTSLSSSTVGPSSKIQPVVGKGGSPDVTGSKVIRGSDPHDTREMLRTHEVVARQLKEALFTTMQL